MPQKIKLIVYPVTDLSASKALFETFLGVSPYVDGPYYVGFRVGDLEIGLDPNATKNGVNSAISYVDVADIKTALQGLKDAGASVLQDIRDVGGGMLVATVKDGDGNILGLRAPK